MERVWAFQMSGSFASSSSEGRKPKAGARLLAAGASSATGRRRILGFAGQATSVPAPALCSAMAARTHTTDNVQASAHGCVPIKLYLQNRHLFRFACFRN